MTVKLKRHILILIGNPDSRTLLEKRLQIMGFECAWARVPDDVIDYLKSNEPAPDLILVDLLKVGELALALPRKIRTLTKWGNLIPLAIYSSATDKASVAAALRSGYSDYIVRPTEPELFEDRITKLVNRIPELNPTTFRKPVHDRAKLELSVELTQINEFGATATSDFSPQVGSIFTLNSRVLHSLGIDSPNVRVSSASSPMKNGLITIQLSFIGLDAHEIRSLRKFALSPDRTQAAMTALA